MHMNILETSTQTKSAPRPAAAADASATVSAPVRPHDPNDVTAAELAAALDKSLSQIRRLGPKRFGPQARTGLHLYKLANFLPADREALERFRGKRADGTGDLSTGKVFVYRGMVIGEDSFSMDERALGEQKSQFVIAVEMERRAQGRDFPTAVSIVRAEEEARAARGHRLEYPDLVGKLTFHNFRKWKEIWNEWRDHDLDEKNWTALCPRQALKARMEKKDFVRSLQLTEAEVNAIRTLILHQDSQPLGLKAYTRDPRCRSEVREAIHCFLDNESGSIPPSLQRAVYIPEEVRTAFRSKKRFRQHGFTQFRGSFYIGKDGQSHDLLPGDLAEADDMTVNQPFWYEWPFGGDPCSDRYGVRVGRGQLLLYRDAFAGKYLSFLLLMRWRDSYRGVDILNWMGRSLRAHGQPRVAARFERGIWESKKIDGVPLFNDDGTFDRRFGGMRELDFELKRTFGPKGKMIEQPMDLLQKHLGIAGVQVGRYRGEFERATKDLTACQAGHRDPRECGFLHGDVLSERIFEALTEMNTSRVRGRLVNGVPDELWTRHVNNDAPLKPLPRDKEWCFLPDFAEVTIRDGCIPVWRKSGDRQVVFPFEIADFVKDGLGHGYRVMVYFDQQMPELGAWVFNNEQRPCNIHNWPVGHFVGIAPHIPDAPQFRIGDGGAETQARKRFCDAYRLNYCALGVFGRKLAQIRESSDGRENLARIESGAGTTAPLALPGVTEQREAVRQQTAQSSSVRRGLDEKFSDADRLKLLRGEEV